MNNRYARLPAEAREDLFLKSATQLLRHQIIDSRLEFSFSSGFRREKDVKTEKTQKTNRK
jgi:hypothetical protein